jgi:hypothetical protein
VRGPPNFAAVDAPSVTGTTPSASPSSVIVGTTMNGSAVGRRPNASNRGAPAALPEKSTFGWYSSA